MWLMTSACVLATVPDISLLSTLVIGACVTSTDPILSQAIAKGPFAELYVSRSLGELISAEAGANDGLASPFLMLALNLITRPDDAGGLGTAMANWVVRTMLYFCSLSSLLWCCDWVSRKIVFLSQLGMGGLAKKAIFYFRLLLGYVPICFSRVFH